MTIRRPGVADMPACSRAARTARRSSALAVLGPCCAAAMPEHTSRARRHFSIELIILYFPQFQELKKGPVNHYSNRDTLPLKMRMSETLSPRRYSVLGIALCPGSLPDNSSVGSVGTRRYLTRKSVPEEQGRRSCDTLCYKEAEGRGLEPRSGCPRQFSRLLPYQLGLALRSPKSHCPFRTTQRTNRPRPTSRVPSSLARHTTLPVITRSEPTA